MKEVKLTLECSCGFKIERTVRTNEYGYFEIPQAYCPNDLNVMFYESHEPIKEVVT